MLLVVNQLINAAYHVEHRAADTGGEDIMALNKVQAHGVLTTFTKLMLSALVINALAYASEFVLLGQLDREIGIVVGCLLVASVLVATGWRWTPAVGALIAGGILMGNPWLLHNLGHPVTSGFFLAALTQGICSVLVVAAGMGATLQNYHKKN
jgi:hypothetical protein